MHMCESMCLQVVRKVHRTAAGHQRVRRAEAEPENQTAKTYIFSLEMMPREHPRGNPKTQQILPDTSRSPLGEAPAPRFEKVRLEPGPRTSRYAFPSEPAMLFACVPKMACSYTAPHFFCLVRPAAEVLGELQPGKVTAVISALNSTCSANLLCIDVCLELDLPGNWTF